MRIAVFLTLFLAAAFGSTDARAQDKPLLVLQLESALELSVTGRKAGLSGAVYALAPTADDTGVHSVQVAFDARNRPVLTRLVRKIAGTTDTEHLLSAAQTVVPLVLPNWTDGGNVLAEQVAPALHQFAAGSAATRTTIQTVEGQTVVLDFIAGEGLAVLDLPVGTLEARRLDENAVRRLISDSTLMFEEAVAEDEQKVLHRRYHAPNGRFGGGEEVSGTIETGSWKTSNKGHYCIETAPISDFRCFAIYETGDSHVAVPVVNGTTDSKGLRRFKVEFGNPGSYTTPRRNDATVAAVTTMIVGGQTEERRHPDGTADRLFLKPDGSYIGLRDGTPAHGHWSVLSDGRRCLIDATGFSECAFLSETDGGTFRLFDVEDSFLGEALYRDGNPNGF